MLVENERQPRFAVMSVYFVDNHVENMVDNSG